MPRSCSESLTNDGVFFAIMERVILDDKTYWHPYHASLGATHHTRLPEGIFHLKTVGDTVTVAHFTITWMSGGEEFADGTLKVTDHGKEASAPDKIIHLRQGGGQLSFALHMYAGKRTAVVNAVAHHALELKLAHAPLYLIPIPRNGEARRSQPRIITLLDGQTVVNDEVEVRRSLLVVYVVFRDTHRTVILNHEGDTAERANGYGYELRFSRRVNRDTRQRRCCWSMYSPLHRSPGPSP